MLSSSRTNGIQYSVLETHNTTRTTVTVVEHMGYEFAGLKQWTGVLDWTTEARSAQFFVTTHA